MRLPWQGKLILHEETSKACQEGAQQFGLFTLCQTGLPLLGEETVATPTGAPLSGHSERSSPSPLPVSSACLEWLKLSLA